MDTPVAQRLRQAIYGAGLSQQFVADALGISKQSVGQFLDGRGTGKKHWAKIAELCKTTPEWIASGTGDSPSWASAQPIPADTAQQILAELKEIREKIEALAKAQGQPAEHDGITDRVLATLPGK